jgi:hypothetical protein
MRVDDLVQFSPESALREMSSSSANAFPAISRAVLERYSEPLIRGNSVHNGTSEEILRHAAEGN